MLACLAEAATRLLELHQPQQALIEASRALADAPGMLPPAPAASADPMAVVRENLVRHQTEGAEEIARFEGSSGELLEFLMLEWWRRYGATKASGITKLISNEAHHFPDLAAFYQEEVIDPAMRLLKDVLKRGQLSGEFKNFDIDSTVMVIIAPMLFFIMSKHANAVCLAGQPNTPPENFIAQHADLIVRGLSASTASS